MAISPFYGNVSGAPSVALCSAMALSGTRNLPALLEWIKEDREPRLERIRLAHRVGARFMKSLVKALSDGRTVARPLPVQRRACKVYGKPVDAFTYGRTTEGTGKGSPRPVTMQHIRTGRIISAPSIAAFCKEAGLHDEAQLHYNDVLLGRKLHMYSWGLASTLSRRLELKDVFGNRYEGTVAELHKRVGASTLNRLLRGQAVGALAPIDHDYGQIILPKQEVVSQIVLTDGKRTFKGSKAVDMAAEVGISNSSISALARGMAPSVSGIRLKRVKVERRQAWHARKLKPVGTVDITAS